MRWEGCWMVSAESTLYLSGGLLAVPFGQIISRSCHHNTAKVLRAGVAHQHAAMIAEFRFNLPYCVNHLRHCGNLRFGLDLNYYSSYDQVKLMAIAFTKGESYRADWSS